MLSSSTSRISSGVLLSLVGFLMVIGAGCLPKSEESTAISANDANQDSSLSFAQKMQPVKLPPKESETTAPELKAGTATEQPVNTPPENTMTNDEKKDEEIKGFPGILEPARISKKQGHISTSKGEIVFDLFDSEAPKAVSNFVALAERGYYDGLKFHRVVPGFVIQGGDPRGDGTGGPGYQFEDEKVTRNYDAGIVAMANSGPNTNGSQFFIMLEDNPSLPKLYTVFGKVTKGLDVVQKIAVGDVMSAIKIEPKK